MKNLLSLLVIMQLVAFGAKAGDNSDGGFGIKGGIGLTTLGFEKASEQKNGMKLGGFGVVSYEKRFSDVFALDIEAGYANKGVQQKEKYNILGNKGTAILKFNLHAVEVALSPKFYIGDNFNIFVGPYADYFVAGKIVGINKPEDGDREKEELGKLFDKDNNPEDSEGDKLYNRFDIGAQAGFEFISDKGIGVGARFQKGFMDFTNKKFVLDDDKWVTNSGIQIYGIFRF